MYIVPILQHKLYLKQYLKFELLTKEISAGYLHEPELSKQPYRKKKKHYSDNNILPL